MYLIIFFFAAIAVWGVIYKFIHPRERIVIRGQADEIDLFTLNGCGVTMVGGFSSRRNDGEIYYVMLTVLFLPILPISCVVATDEGTTPNLLPLGSNTDYRIYGKGVWQLWEVLSIYAIRWGIGGALVCMIVSL